MVNVGSPGGGSGGGWFAVLYVQSGQPSGRLVTQDVPGAAFVQAASADAAAAQVLARDRSITIEGTPLGPFATRAGAQAAAGKAQQQVAAATQAGSIPNPLAGIDAIGAVLQAFFTTVTDWHFWASLGWLLFGLSLMIMGIRLWLGKPALPKIPGSGSLPSVVPVPV